MAQFGSYLIATLLLLAGIFLMSMWDFQQIVDHFQSIQDRLSHVSAKSQARQEEKEAKRAAKKEAKAAERQAKLKPLPNKITRAGTHGTSGSRALNKNTC